MALALQNLDDDIPSDGESEGSGEGAEEDEKPHPLISLPSKLSFVLASPRTPDGTPRTPPHSSRPATTATRRRDHSVYELLQDINYDQIIAARDGVNDGGLSLKDFVGLFSDINKGQALDENTISQLCNLFNEVDANGDNEVSLEELTSFIVQCGIEPNFKQYIQQYEQVPLVVEDNNFFGLQKVKYFPDLDRVVICDKTREGSVKIMRFHTYNNETGLRLTKELKGHTGTVLNCAYDKETTLFATSSLDHTVRVWDSSNHWRNRTFSTRHPQLALTFSSVPDRLVTSDTLGLIHVWDLQGDGPCQSIAEFMRHSDMAMDLATIPNTPLLASASLDSKIILWDLSSGGATRELTGHTKGIFSLGYAQDYRVLISGGSDRVAIAWNPIANRSTPIFRLKGHHTSLVGVDTARAPLIVTADISGWFKLWDIRTYECIQTFTTDPVLTKSGEEGELTSFTTCGAHNFLLAGGNRLLSLKYDRPTVPHVTDAHPLVYATFTPHTRTLLTASKKSLKVWDAHTGCLLHSFNGIISETADISAACVDSTGRRLFVGDSEGNINVFNYSNGTHYREYSKHSSQVLKILECPTTRAVISCSSNTIFLHHSLEHLSNTYPPPMTTLVRALEVKTDITSLAYSPTLALIAVGCFGRAESLLTFFDGNTGSLDASFSPNEAEITGIQFLDPYPVIVTSDSTGAFIFSTVRPHPQKYRVVYSMENFSNGITTSTIQEMSFFSNDKLLFTGDEAGEIKAWNLHNFFLYSNLFPVEVATNHNITYKSKLSSIGTIPQPSLMEGGYGGASFESFMGPFLMYKWKAHHSTVSCLSILTPTPPSPPSSSSSHPTPMTFHTNPPPSTPIPHGTTPIPPGTSPTPSSLPLDPPLSNMPTLLSAGKDGRARAWSLNGHYLGTLRDRRDPDHSDSWLFEPPPGAEEARASLNRTVSELDAHQRSKAKENQQKFVPKHTSTRHRRRRPPLLTSPHKASWAVESTSPLARADRSAYYQEQNKEDEEESQLLDYLNQVSTQKKYSEKQKKAAEKLITALDSLNTR